jgi:outer membrane protein TolC
MLLTVTKQSNCSRGGDCKMAYLLTGCFAVFFSAGIAAVAQTPDMSQPGSTGPSASAAPVVITLDEAIHRAQANEPNFVAAVAGTRIARLDRYIARSSLLPNARYFSQGIYTQPNGIRSDNGEGVPSAPNPRFVANDSRPREYFAQGVVDESFSLAGVAAVRRADAASAMAQAQQEVARRGLVAAVTLLFYGSLAADQKLAVAERALTEANDFLKVTNEREQAREAAHADAVKAQLQVQQRQRDLENAKVAAETARLELGILLFPDPRTAYTLQAEAAPAPLAPRADIEQAAAKNNPELKSALAALKVSNADVLAARAAYLPTLGLNVTYGIDANEFAVNGPMTPSGLQARNLGYSATWTVNLPLWDWLSTEHRVKQSEIRRDVAKVALSTTQRQLVARLQEAYSEAVAARDQLTSLDASVATAGESLRLTRLRYNGGEATVLEVVDAESAYVLAENAREDGRVRFEMARANLQTFTGTM